MQKKGSQKVEAEGEAGPVKGRQNRAGVLGSNFGGSGFLRARNERDGGGWAVAIHTSAERGGSAYF